MPSRFVKCLRLLTLFVSVAFAAGSGVAVAQTETQSDEVIKLSGNIELLAAFDPVEIYIPYISSSLDGSLNQSVAITVNRAQLEGLSDAPYASALPWFERFTVAAAQSQILWSTSEDFEVSAGERWGVTLGYRQNERDIQSFDLQDFTAGAFFEFSDRVRLGGELRFTSPEAEIFGEPTEEKTPEIRFESAFKF